MAHTFIIMSQNMLRRISCKYAYYFSISACADYVFELWCNRPKVASVQGT
ncbi:hypothetical protein B7P43_G08555 [Cryptotermes secundus]|uniref:Uncharacterized protein n=1 Tax=Cryptotermes secundus TaxID=105785 RepID=A0A2J7QES0_9NEOP|nr:hypothetical protein B7P43_G08555 [Cryptotermes secundus]